MHPQDDYLPPKEWPPDALPPVVFQLPRLHSVAMDVGSSADEDGYPLNVLPTMPLGYLEELDLQVSRRQPQQAPDFGVTRLLARTKACQMT
jgi:hypothetical protein